MHRGPATAAAVVNALVVLFLPWVVTVLLPSGTNSSAIAYADEWSRWLSAIRNLIETVLLLAPFAALAAWRTWVHAGHWLDGERCWRGVLEAGLAAFLVVFVGLAHAIGANGFRRPVLALGYVTVYATVACIIGLGVGAVLQLMAMVVLIVSALVERTPSGG